MLLTVFGKLYNMALTTQDIEVLKQAKSQGKTKEQALAMLATTKKANISEPTSEKPFANKVTDFLGLGGTTNTFGKVANQFGIGVPEGVDKQYLDKATPGQVAGAVLQTAAIPAAFALTGGASVAGQAAVGAGLGYAYDVGQDLIEKKSAGEVLTPGMGTVIGGVAPLAIKGLAAGVGALKKPAEKITSATGEAITNTIPDGTIVQGTKQKATEIVERIPRFIGRKSDELAQDAAKAKKIRTAPPAVAQALKVDLPEKYINTVTQADPATKAAYKRALEIAEETPKTVGVKQNPTIVGGELAGKQYELIEKQRKTIGNAIGEEVKKLGLDKAKVDMRVGLSQVDDVLTQQGIRVGDDGRLAFTGKYTPAERARIQELYTMARESGDVLTPTQVRDMDQLFSKLQRETRMEGVGDLRVDVNGQNMSMFRVFRDIYANQLENLSPELRKLNSQYRNVVTLMDDIEDSIIKTPNFNVTKTTDPAEFAKVNLRRIFGEAQSSPAYEAIADEMDTIARQLGYADAKPKDIAAFAQEIRELYPESVPRTGFSGGIKSGIGELLQSVSQAGKADVIDQRKALMALLEATEEAAQ
jgi:hypothetical protein